MLNCLNCYLIGKNRNLACFETMSIKRNEFEIIEIVVCSIPSNQEITITVFKNNTGKDSTFARNISSVNDLQDSGFWY